VQIKRIQISNFQSLAAIDISLSPGMTVIVGRSEAGKTALVRAIHAFFTNQAEKGYVRDGASETSVRLQLDGHLCEWRRTKRGASFSSSYDVDGESYQRMGRQVPAFIGSLASPFVLGKTSYGLLQIQHQASPPFLTSSADAQSSKGLDAIEGKIFREALSACQSELRAKSKAYSAVVKSLDVIEDEIEPLLTKLEQIESSSNSFYQRCYSILYLILRKTMEEATSQMRSLVVLAEVLRQKLIPSLDQAFSTAHALSHLSEYILYLQEKLKLESQLPDEVARLKFLTVKLVQTVDCPYWKTKGECPLFNALYRGKG